MIKNIPNINATWNDPNPFRGGVGFSCYGNDERFYGSNGNKCVNNSIMAS